MDYLNSSKQTLLSDYEHNPLLKLIFFCGSGYVFLHLVKIIVFMWWEVPSPESTPFFHDHIYINAAIQPLEGMKSHPWTIITFMFTGMSFFKLFTSLVWLFIFGSMVQRLVGRSEILPLFIATNIIGGIAFIILISYFPLPIPNNMFTGPDAAIIGYALGVLVLAPNYKFDFSDTLKIPLWLLVIAYLALNAFTIIDLKNYAYLGLLFFGGVSGIVFMVLAKKGWKLGALANLIILKINRRISPKNKIAGKVFEKESLDLDKILDKVNDTGYQSLNKQERLFLKEYK
ncbi:MAG TPA: rhomboid family intramembrane serine protease [Edaphocola sp.]|nr:rhomboid family intramembrane serine protease [Edaphocola sp.]